MKQFLLVDAKVKAIFTSGCANVLIRADDAAYGCKGAASKPSDLELQGNVFRNLFD